MRSAPGRIYFQAFGRSGLPPSSLSVTKESRPPRRQFPLIGRTAGLPRAPSASTHSGIVHDSADRVTFQFFLGVGKKRRIN